MLESGRLAAADALYLDRIRDDVTSWLGPGAMLLELRPEPAAAGVRLVVRYRLEARERESTAEGETVYAAHVALRATILWDRLRFGFEDAVDRP